MCRFVRRLIHCADEGGSAHERGGFSEVCAGAISAKQTHRRKPDQQQYHCVAPHSGLRPLDFEESRLRRVNPLFRWTLVSCKVLEMIGDTRSNALMRLPSVSASGSRNTR